MSIFSSRLISWRAKVWYLVLAIATISPGILVAQESLAIESQPLQNAQIAADYAANKANSEAATPEVSKAFVRSLLRAGLSFSEQYARFPDDEFRTQLRAVELYAQIGDTAAADATLERAIATTRKFNSGGEYEALLLAKVATAYGQLLDDEAQMEAVLRQALTLTSEVEEHQVSNVIESVASVYVQMGRYEDAIALTDQFAEVLFIQSERESIIKNAALHARTQGQHDFARKLILEAEEIVSERWGGESAEHYQDRITYKKVEMLDFLTYYQYEAEEFEQGAITAGIEQALIESISDPLERVDLYMDLAETLNRNDLDEEALGILPRAIAAAEQLTNQKTDPDNCYLRKADNSFIDIGAAMITANTVDRGLALLDTIENGPCAVNTKLESLFQIARSHGFDTDAAARLVTAKIEELIPQASTHEERSSYWFDLAEIYRRIDREAQAIQISDRLWQMYQSDELIRENPEEEQDDARYFWGWDYILLKWVHFLDYVEEYEKAARVAIDIDDQSMLDSLAPELVRAGNDELAQETLEAIDGLNEKVRALRWMSLHYLMIPELEKAREVLSTAVKEIETADLSELVATEWYRYDTGETLTQLEKEQTIQRNYLEYVFRLHILSAGDDSAMLLTTAISGDELRQEMVTFVEQNKRPESLNESWTAADGRLTEEMMMAIQYLMATSKPSDLQWTLMYEGDYIGALEVILSSVPIFDRGSSLISLAEEYLEKPQPIEKSIYEELLEAY